MHRLTLDVSDSSLKKLSIFLNKFSKNEVKILDNHEINIDENDIIHQLVNNPVNVDSEISFLSREEANAR